MEGRMRAGAYNCYQLFDGSVSQSPGLKILQAKQVNLPAQQMSNDSELTFWTPTFRNPPCKQHLHSLLR